MSVHVNQKPIWPTNYVASEQGPGLFIRRGHAPINLSSKHICHYNSDNRRNISIAIHQQQHTHAPVPHLRISLCSCPGSCFSCGDRKESNRIRALYCRHSVHSVTDGWLKSSPCSLFAFSRKCRGRGPSDLSVFVYSVSDLINSPIEINNYPPGGGGLLMVLVGGHLSRHAWRERGRRNREYLEETEQYNIARHGNWGPVSTKRGGSFRPRQPVIFGQFSFVLTSDRMFPKWSSQWKKYLLWISRWIFKWIFSVVINLLILRKWVKFNSRWK